jgi:hypothetical protein
MLHCVVSGLLRNLFRIILVGVDVSQEELEVTRVVVAQRNYVFGGLLCTVGNCFHIPLRCFSCKISLTLKLPLKALWKKRDSIQSTIL